MTGYSRLVGLEFVIKPLSDAGRIHGNAVAPARHLPHLTKLFYRVDSGRSRDSGGTGLGLSIMNRSLARHKGRLNISSEAGQGTRFRCEFPLELGWRKGDEVMTGK